MLHEYIQQLDAHIKDNSSKKKVDLFDINVTNKVADCYALMTDYANRKRIKNIPLADTLTTKQRSKETIQFRFNNLDMGTVLDCVAESGFDSRIDVREDNNEVIIEIE